MSSSSTRSPSASTRTDKNKKQSKIAVIKLPPKLLRRFLVPALKVEERSQPSAVSSPAPAVEDNSTLKVPEVNDNLSESASTPAPTPNADAADNSSGDGSKKRKGGSLAGNKRSLGQMTEGSGTPKPRGKPGPKKKPRL